MDRITKVSIRNVRAIESVDLDLGRPLTVLIGENGAGKSTILECLELLRKVSEPNFFDQLYSVHRGLPALLRKGADTITLAAELVDEDLPREQQRLAYSLTLRVAGAGASIVDESIVASDGFYVVGLDDNNPSVWNESFNSFERITNWNKLRSSLWAFGDVPPDRRISRVRRALGGIEVHLPFDTMSSWAARTYQRPQSIRASSTLFPANRLNLLGVNLANAWYELNGRQDDEREATLGLLRLGLGERVSGVVVPPDHGGGVVHLALRFRDLPEPVFAGDLSDGQLAWLAFVALVRLAPNRSLLAVDEPELHMHPSLLGRVVSLLAHLPGGAPAVMSTHSDRVLELLDNPADAVRVCSLNGSRADVSRIDAEELPRWLEQFGDLGQLRAAGYLSRVLEQTPLVARPDEGGE